jgi:Family of unknown function (DUF5995)
VSLSLQLPATLTTTADVRTWLSALEPQLLTARDRRGVFVTSYLTITKAVEAQCDAGGFRDPAWVRRYLVAFGTLYRDALRQDQLARSATAGATVHRVPKAWRVAFDAARERRGWVIQHLMLGVNAHINHDLALALLMVGIDANRMQCYADHTAVNAVLERATLTLKTEVATKWAPVLERLDAVGGTLDDDVTEFSIAKARDHAWAMAVAIDATRGTPGEALVRAALNDQAGVLARLILAPPVETPVIATSKRLLERLDQAARVADRVAAFASGGRFGV